MSHLFASGLVVGKFCPLHLGHESLIEAAIADCDEVIVISYANPQPTCCPAALRDHWIAERFPGVVRLVLDQATLSVLCETRGQAALPLPRDDDEEEVHRAFVAWLCRDILGRTVEAVFTSEDYGDGFAASLARHFAARNPAHAGVQHVCVDRLRTRVPTSGSRLRADAFAHRQFVSPQVYADLVGRIAILGGESSGKTTLAQALARHLDTACVPEFGRELWLQRQGRLVFDDLLHIATGQVAREQAEGMQARRWLVCDTTPLTTAFYSDDLFGKVDPGLAALAQREYAHVFLCAPDFPFVQDGTRRDAGFRARQHLWYQRELQARGIPWTDLSGDLQARLHQAMAALA